MKTVKYRIVLPTGEEEAGQAVSLFVKDAQNVATILPDYGRTVMALKDGALSLSPATGTVKSFSFKSGFLKVQNNSVFCCIVS
ncbi:MAG: hypothetical protein AAB066_05720 [Candidatus Margulisiibacteriota bacterium]